MNRASVLVVLLAMVLSNACGGKKKDPCIASSERVAVLVNNVLDGRELPAATDGNAQDVQGDMARLLALELCKKNRISPTAHTCIKTAKDIFAVIDTDGCGVHDLMSLVGPSLDCLDDAKRKGPVQTENGTKIVFCELGGERHGEYVEFSNATRLVSANYRKGMLDGEFRSRHNKIEGEYKAGKKTGIWRQDDDSGYLLAELSFVEGVPGGAYRGFYDGKREAVAEEGTFLRGLREGIWTQHWRGNVLKSEGEYQGGKRHGQWQFFRGEGVKSAKGDYLDGERVGTWSFFDETDQPMSEEAAMEDEFVQEALAALSEDHPSLVLSAAAAP